MFDSDTYYRFQRTSGESVEARVVFRADGRAQPGDLYLRGDGCELRVSPGDFFQKYERPSSTSNPAYLALDVARVMGVLGNAPHKTVKVDASWGDPQVAGPRLEALACLGVKGQVGGHVCTPSEPPEYPPGHPGWLNPYTSAYSSGAYAEWFLQLALA